VTGVLPIALGRATRIVQYLLKAGKEYVAIIHLHKEVQKRDIKKVFKEFTGKIKQIPPLKSSVKREERERYIYYIEILEIIEKDILFKVGCEAGTYIRKLCFDIGKKLGCGAHMAELRRTKAGPFDESTLITLHDLLDAYILWKEKDDDKLLRRYIQPLENAITYLPKIWVFDTTVESLCHGVNLKIPGISRLNDQIKKNDTVAIMTLKDELIGLGKAQLSSEDIIKKNSGLAVKTEKVFMIPGNYLK
jgi:H/ACA ribonucleoprotein complex subunit 4